LVDASLYAAYMVPLGVFLLSLDTDRFDWLFHPAAVVLGAAAGELMVAVLWVTRLNLLGDLPPHTVLPYAVGGVLSMLLFQRQGWGLMGAAGASALILHAGLTLWEYSIQIPIRSPFMLFANLITFVCLAVSVPLLRFGENKLRYVLLLAPPVAAWLVFVSYPPAGGMYTPSGFPVKDVGYWIAPVWTVIRLLSILAVIGVVDAGQRHVLFQDRVVALIRRGVKRLGY
jgi:hypothetical protein